MQLEEFERAVSLSHENYPSEENTITRHREFIAALRNKISHVEKAISDSLPEEGKQPLRWIQLDEEERDDFEIFLSMPPQSLQGNKDNKYAEHESVRGFKETVTISKDAKYIVEVAAKEPFGNQDEVTMQEENSSSQRRAINSSDIGAWKIVIADEDDANKNLGEARAETHSRASTLWGFFRSIESTAKLKWFRSSFGKAKSGEHIQSGQGFSSYLDLKGIGLFSQVTIVISRNFFRCI